MLYVYKRSFVIKTFFFLYLFIKVLESFPDLVLPALYIYIYIYIKVAVVNLLHLRESWRCRKGPKGLLHAGLVLGHDRGSLCRDCVCSSS